jgi:cysteine desulfurase
MMQVNNETGVVQDIAALGKILRERKIIFHVDAAQSAGKIAIDLLKLPVDLLSLSSHKLYGPKGVGALYISDVPRVRLIPQLHGGPQERKLRAGTLATHQIVGFGEACRIAQEMLAVEGLRIQEICDQFLDDLNGLPNVVSNVDRTVCVPHIVNVQFQQMDKTALKVVLQDLAVSFGSACNAMSLEPSYVLRAIGLADKAAERSVRFSFGRFTTIAEVRKAAKMIAIQYDNYRRT